MVYRKGERTNRHRERDFPYAVDIPIPPGGLRHEGMGEIERALEACSGRAENWSVSSWTGRRGEAQWFARIGVQTEEDAKRIMDAFEARGARRAR